MSDNTLQFRVEWHPGRVRLMISNDDGSFRFIEVPPLVAHEIALGIIKAAHFALLPKLAEATQPKPNPTTTTTDEPKPLIFDESVISEADQVYRWVDEYAKRVKI
jgi:hypothetical protein